MQPNMRRADRQISQAEAFGIMEKGDYGVLSTVGADGQPYGVPLFYIVRDQCIYFHCATVGHKLQNLAHEPRASFCVTGGVKAVFEGGFTACFSSAVAFGGVEEVTDAKEKREALRLLCERYLPAHMEKADGYIEKFLEKTGVYKMRVLQITGKARAGTAKENA